MAGEEKVPSTDSREVAFPRLTDIQLAEVERCTGCEAIRGSDLDEAKASEALRRAEDAMRKSQDKQEIATLQAEFAMMAAQLAAIRRLRKK